MLPSITSVLFLLLIATTTCFANMVHNTWVPNGNQINNYYFQPVSNPSAIFLMLVPPEVQNQKEHNIRNAQNIDQMYSTPNGRLIEIMKNIVANYESQRLQQKYEENPTINKQTTSMDNISHSPKQFYGVENTQNYSPNTMDPSPARGYYIHHDENKYTTFRDPGYAQYIPIYNNIFKTATLSALEKFWLSQSDYTTESSLYPSPIYDKTDRTDQEYTLQPEKAVLMKYPRDTTKGEDSGISNEQFATNYSKESTIYSQENELGKKHKPSLPTETNKNDTGFFPDKIENNRDSQKRQNESSKSLTSHVLESDSKKFSATGSPSESTKHLENDRIEPIDQVNATNSNTTQNDDKNSDVEHSTLLSVPTSTVNPLSLPLNDQPYIIKQDYKKRREVYPIISIKKSTHKN